MIRQYRERQLTRRVTIVGPLKPQVGELFYVAPFVQRITVNCYLDSVNGAVTDVGFQFSHPPGMLDHKTNYQRREHYFRDSIANDLL